MISGVGTSLIQPKACLLQYVDLISEEIDLSIFLELDNKALQIIGFVEHGMGASYHNY